MVLIVLGSSDTRLYSDGRVFHQTSGAYFHVFHTSDATSRVVPTSVCTWDPGGDLWTGCRDEVRTVVGQTLWDGRA